MGSTTPRVRSLLRQARKTARAGKRAAAKQLYEQILEEAPRTVEAWLGLAEVSRDPQESATAYRRVLELDPENEKARRHLGQEAGAVGVDAAEPGVDGAGSRQDDPFSQTRQWLDEATAREPQKPGEAESVEAPDPVSVEVPAGADLGPPQAAEMEAQEGVLYCYRHPNRATGLRCITCNRPICTKCAQHTPVGYRCPQCIREAQDVFFTAGIVDYLVVAVVTLILGLLAGAIAPRLGFFVIFIGPAAGSIIGRIAFRVGRRQHGRYLPHLVAALVALGGFLPSGLPIVLALLFGSASIAQLGLGLLWPAIYVFLATGAAYYQVK